MPKKLMHPRRYSSGPRQMRNFHRNFLPLPAIELNHLIYYLCSGGDSVSARVGAHFWYTELIRILYSPKIGYIIIESPRKYLLIYSF
jgi:hypothetical protein